MSYGGVGHSEVGRTLAEGLRKTDLHTFWVLHFINYDFSVFFLNLPLFLHLLKIR